MDKMSNTLPNQELDAQVGFSMQERGEGDLKNEIEKYKRLIEDIPDPNCGRIQELREAIKKGTFLTKEAILETAERIAARFLGKE